MSQTQTSGKSALKELLFLFPLVLLATLVGGAIFGYFVFEGQSPEDLIHWGFSENMSEPKRFFLRTQFGMFLFLISFLPALMFLRPSSRRQDTNCPDCGDHCKLKQSE